MTATSYHLYYLYNLTSTTKVAGPSFTRSTCIVAPNRPRFTGRTVSAASLSQNRSYIRSDAGGFIAKSNPGRLPFERSAQSVNCCHGSLQNQPRLVT